VWRINTGLSLSGIAWAWTTWRRLGATEKGEILQIVFERIQAVDGFCQMLNEKYFVIDNGYAAFRRIKDD
jgi:hypothetical protein